MKTIRSKKSYKLGVICPTDFVYGVSGGAAGFISNIMNDFSAEKVIIFGISLSKLIPWDRININKKVEFLPICKLKYPSKIPMRIKVLFIIFIIVKEF